MASITISIDTKKIKGSLKELVVKPYGESAHIILPRKESGKIVNVIIPDDAKIVWVLSKQERREIVKAAREAVEKGHDRTRFYLIGSINNFEDKTFEIDDLLKVVGLLEENSKNKKLISKLERVYGLND